MSSPSHWKPNDWLRLIALLGAFGLFGVGSWMLFRGISAEGFVDLKSSLLSGTLRASSAGLYICFFALFIIVFVLVTLVTPPREGAAKAKGRARRLAPVFWALLFALAACGLGIAFLPEGFRGFAGIPIGVLSFSLASVVVAMIRMTYDDNS
jgi:hypothetical protein